MRTLRSLTNHERLQLESQLKKTKDLAEWKRLFVILSYDEGQSVEDLARLTRLSLWTVETYLKEYSSSNKTKNDPRGGSSSKLTESEAQSLEDHLQQVTYLKVKDIVCYVKGRFSKEYSRSGMTDWLLNRGFTFKRPEKVPGKVNPDQQKEFIEYYKNLKATLGANEELYFVDAMHPEYQSQAVSGWIKKGECKTLQTTGKQKRLHFSGALNLTKMKVFVREYETVDADAMIHFFQQLEEDSPAKTIHIILDNARAHKNHKLDEYLEQSKIRLHYLPPYSPNLNPIERLWKFFREQTLYNRYFPTCWEFFATVRDFFANKVHKLKGLLHKRISDNFQQIELNPIRIG
jgi:transposase